MGKYDHYSKKELLELIEKFEAERDSSETVMADGKNPCADSMKEKYAASILEKLPDMLTILSPEGICVEVLSAENVNHVGVCNSDMRGMDIRDMLSEEAYSNVKANLDNVIATGNGSMSHHNITLDGNIHHYENRIVMLDNKDALCICRDVTKQTKTNDKLERAMHRMQQAEKIASLSHWYYYEERDEVEAPELISLLAGLKSADKTRCSRTQLLSYLVEADRIKVSKLLLNPDREHDYIEFRLPVDGRIRYMHSRVIHITGKEGHRVVEGYVQDMTYLVERLHELEAMRYTLHNVVEEIYACDIDGTLEFANEQFRRCNNLPDDISNIKVFELDSQKITRVQWSEYIGKVRRNGGTYKYTVKFRDHEGRNVDMEIASHIIYDNNKEKEMVWAFGRDISERIKNEMKLKQLNSLMNTILNNIPCYLFVKDPGNEFRYMYWNKAFEEFSHIPAGKAIGQTDAEIFPNPQDAEKFHKDDLALLQTGQRIDLIEDYETATGQTRVVTTSKVLVPVENRLPLLIGISLDITDIKTVERELIEARIKAEESDRLKSAFLANMSHELRTPLNAIVGFSKLISEADSNEDKQMYADIIDSNSELLLQLINDILDISKIEADTLEFKYKDMNLNDLCREQHETHKGRTKRGVTLTFDEKHKDVIISSDYNRMAQVINNLINNAIKFTESGEIRFGFDIKDSMINFYVSDTGVGIPEDRVVSIFDRFIKLNDFAAGTGLGLSISKMIVEKLGGSIYVESKVGTGTSFHFSIPYRHNESSQDKEQPLSWEKQKQLSTKPAVCGKKILVAEDIDSNYLLLQALIGKRYELIRAMNGKEAVKLAGTVAPDIVFMDLKMPVMDGYEAMRIIKEEHPELPVIAMSAFAFENDIEKAFEAGCDNYLTKPLSHSALIKVLDHYL